MADSNNQSVGDISGLLHSYLKRLKDDQEKLIAEIRLVESKLAQLGNGVECPTKRRRRPRGTNQTDVERALLDNPQKTFTVGQLADIIKIRTSSVRYALQQLSDKGITKEVSKGYWQVVPKESA